MRCPSGLAVSASRGIRPPAEASMAAVRVGRVGPHRKREAGRDWRPRPSAGCTRGSCRPKVSHRSSARGPGEGLTSEPSEGKAPLLDALRERGRRGHEVSMHFPGHKRGAGAHPRLLDILGTNALRHDLTELQGLDFLAYPDGPILEAQQLAAETFGADKTWMLVNGSTGGIQAAILATCRPGDHVVLSRNCHQSAFSALVVSGCLPIYVTSPIHEDFGVAASMLPGPLEAVLEEAVTEGRHVGAVVAVSPTYFGACADVKALSETCHRFGVPLVVDEAHGAHLSQHPSLPPSALHQGADIAIQSTHKVLGSMTQSSMLHVRGPRISHARVSQALQTLQSSSPSYLLMASLDAARQAIRLASGAISHFRDRIRRLRIGDGFSAPRVTLAAECTEPMKHLQVDEGTALFEAYNAAAAARAGIAAIDGVRLLGERPEDLAGMSEVDPFRLTCDLRSIGMSGGEACHLLEEQFSVVAELSTPQVVVFSFGAGSTMEDAVKLVSAMQALADRQKALPESSAARVADGDADDAASGGEVLPVMAVCPRDAFFAGKERVEFHASEGRIAGELLCPYPPGVPLILPGEVITADLLKRLRGVLNSGGKILGSSDSTLGTILVLS